MVDLRWTYNYLVSNHTFATLKTGYMDLVLNGPITHQNQPKPIFLPGLVTYHSRMIKLERVPAGKVHHTKN